LPSPDTVEYPPLPILVMAQRLCALVVIEPIVYLLEHNSLIQTDGFGQIWKKGDWIFLNEKLAHHVFTFCKLGGLLINHSCLAILLVFGDLFLWNLT